jgi:hypothetical protein
MFWLIVAHIPPQSAALRFLTTLQIRIVPHSWAGGALTILVIGVVWQSFTGRGDFEFNLTR